MRRPLLLVAFVLAACQRSPSPSIRTLDVEVGGCAAFSVANGCALASDRKIRVHVREADTRPTFEHATATRIASAEAGELYELVVAAGESEVGVHATPRDGAAEAHVPVYVAPQFQELREIDRLRTSGDLEAALVLANARAHADTADAHERNLAEGAIARIALRRGQNDEAERRLASTVDVALAHGWLSDAADDTFARAFVLHQRSRRFAEARVALDALEPRLASYADGRAKLPLYRGQLLLETGDLRGALREFRAAADATTRLGLGRESRAARQLLAQALAKSGRANEALSLVTTVRREVARAGDATACERIEIAMAAAYVALRTTAAEDGDTLSLARDALSVPRETIRACADVYLTSLLSLHTARVSVRRADVAATREGLSAFRTGTTEPRLTDTLEALDVEGRLAMLEREPKLAIVAYRTMKELAARSRRVEHRWRGALGVGAAFAALGKRHEAIVAYREAEDALDEDRSALDLGDGNTDFLRETSESAWLLAEALAFEGKAAEAELVVRRARARSLAMVAALAEERARTPEADRALEGVRKMRDLIDAETARDWRRSAAERISAEGERRVRLEAAIRDLETAARLAPSRILPTTAPRPLEPETASLTVVRRRGATSRALLVLATVDARTIAYGVPLSTPFAEADFARALLDPIEGSLTRVKRVRVFLARDLADLDVHALPYHGAPLVKSFEVVYAEDLGAPRAWGVGPALVVADPSDDLPSARSEGEIAARGLARGGATVLSVFGREATATRVRAALEEASFFHYAGHARFGGPAGLGSDLPLAAGTALSFADVLALRRVPRSVVLSGCDAGKGELGLARAWLVAGSEVVVAPSRVVSDAAGKAFAESLHRATNDPHDLVRGARTATLDAIARGDSEWRAFRTFVR